MRHPDLPMFELAILKGLIEHNDGTIYFGSLLGWQTHCVSAIAKGYVAFIDPDVGSYSSNLAVTTLGRELYEHLKLSSLPTRGYSRAYMWNWDNVSNVMFPPEPKKIRRRKNV